MYSYSPAVVIIPTPSPILRPAKTTSSMDRVLSKKNKCNESTTAGIDKNIIIDALQTNILQTKQSGQKHYE